LTEATPDLARRAAAEAIATFALVFAGCGAIVTDAVYGGALGVTGIALVFGLVITVMIYATGHLSSTSAISAPVIRTRRSAAIASTRPSSVRLATVVGAEQRSSRPSSPSAR
jgi:hypothetical protein